MKFKKKMSSNEFNELLNSLKSQTLQSNSLGMGEESLYVWKPVPIVSSPFKEVIKELPIQNIPTIQEIQPLNTNTQINTQINTPTNTPMIQNQNLQPQLSTHSQFSPPNQLPPSVFSHVQQQPSYFENKDSSVYSYNPPSTIYQSFAQTPHQYLQQPNVQILQTEEKKNFWFEWSIYIFGFALILFIIFFALWYFYVKDYNKIYPLNQPKENTLENDSYKIPPPSYLKTKILEENPHFKNDDVIKETMEKAEELLKKENNIDEDDEIEYFKPETIMETLFEEKKEKDKKKKSYFDLSDVDSSEFETKETKVIVKTDNVKLTDESDEVKKYAEKRSKLFT